MGLQHELTFLQRAPAACKALAVLEKVDGPLEFVGPTAVHDLAVAVVDEHE